MFRVDSISIIFRSSSIKAALTGSHIVLLLQKLNEIFMDSVFIILFVLMIMQAPRLIVFIITKISFARNNMSIQ